MTKTYDLDKNSWNTEPNNDGNSPYITKTCVLLTFYCYFSAL